MNVHQLVQNACLLVPPLWPLQDSVAVNPFLGYAHQSILQTDEAVHTRLGAHVIPTLETFQELFKNHQFNVQHLDQALLELSQHPLFKPNPASIPLNQDSLLLALENKLSFDIPIPYSSVANYLDKSSNYLHKWKADITTDISRCLASKHDQGIARWNPIQTHEPLFKTWLKYASVSKGMSARGLKHFSDFVKTLPENPISAIEILCTHLELNAPNTLTQCFTSLLGELPGWSGYLRHFAWKEGVTNVGDLPDLLAIRMAYDAALKRQYPDTPNPFEIQTLNDPTLLFRYTCLRALEMAYLESVQKTLTTPTHFKKPERAATQWISCIDVRSEIVRRHLVSINPQIETYGFAGFFGIAVALEHLYFTQPQYPALLTPSLTAKAPEQPQSIYKKLLKFFSKSANSCYTYVETIGFASFFSMLSDLFSVSITHHIKAKKPSTSTPFAYSFSPNTPFETQVQIAQNLLNQLKLNEPFAPLVVFCGHTSTPKNNPQAAALACGACGGHSGEPNAILAASLLNNVDIRKKLIESGYTIPEDTHFMAALHNTVTDEINILSHCPSTHTHLLSKLKSDIKKASEKTRSERALQLDIAKKQTSPANLLSELIRRKSDIAEVRPEWGLSGNAGFIIADTETLALKDFKGRCFLHHYNHTSDSNREVLTSILKGPVTVASWINLQYFASSSDPEHFGSGLKTIHNIMGGIGVICGNDGDLEPGLSFQSIHNGTHLQHPPIRLQLCIQASLETIQEALQSDSHLLNLVKNEWILVFSLDSTDNQLTRVVPK